MLKRLLCTLSCAVILAGASIGSALSADSEAAGFLTRNGTELLLDGKPFRAFAMNKVNLFWDCLKGEAEFQQELDYIDHYAAHGYRVVRFAATDFYPKEMKLWADKVYWERMDKIFAKARRCGVYLVPTIIWNPHLFPDMAHESMQDMMTNPDSRSRQYLDYYLFQIVSRYKDDTNVLYWEISNELNLYADLECVRPLGFSEYNAVSRGAPPVRLRQDNYTTGQMISFLREIALAIRRIDPNHLICSGHSIPRQAAQHLRLSNGKGDWTEDSPEEAKTYIRDVHPDPIDLISIHFYASDGGNIRFGNKDKDSAVALRTIRDICDEIGKPVVIGECGHEAVGLGDCPPFSRNVVEEAAEANYPILLYWTKDDMCDLGKMPALNKLLHGAEKKLVEHIARKE